MVCARDCQPEAGAKAEAQVVCNVAGGQEMGKKGGSVPRGSLLLLFC